MANAVNIATNQLEDVPQDQLPSALINQTHGLAPGSQVDMYHPNGEMYTVPAESVQQALQSGYKFPSQAELTELSNQQKFGGAGNSLKAAAQGALRGATFGLSDFLLDKEEAKQLKERHPISSTAGELGGIIADPLGTVGALGALGKTTTEGAKVVAEGLGIGSKAGAGVVERILNQSLAKAAGSAVEGAGFGAGNVISEYALGNPNLTAESAAHHILMSELLGAGIGGTLGFAESALPPFLEGTKKALGNVSEAIGAEGPLDSIKNKIADIYASASSLVSGMSKDEIRAVIKNRGQSAVPLKTDELVDSLSDLYKHTDNAFGEAKISQVEGISPEILDSFGDAQNEFRKRFMYKVGKGGGIQYKMDPVKVENFIKNIDTAQGAARADALADFSNSASIMTDHLEDVYKSLPDRTSLGTDSINQVLDKNEALIQKGHEQAVLNKLTGQAARQPGASGLLEAGAGAAAAHAAGLSNPAIGALVGGYEALKYPILTVQRLARLEEMVQNTGRQIVRGAEILANPAKSTAGYLKGYVASKLTSEQYGKESDKIRNLASNPEHLASTLQGITEPIQKHAPDTTAQLNSIGGNAVSFLNSKLPQVQNTSPLAPSAKPSQQEIAKFSRYYGAVQNPTSVLKSAASGQLSNEEVEALHTVYPNLYDKIQTHILSGLTENKNRQSIPYQRRLMLTMLVGKDVDGSLSPQSILANQTALGLAHAQQQAKEAAFMGAGKIRAKGLDNLSFNTRELTAQQKSNRRIE